MREYHKIQTVFLRDPQTNYKTLLEGEFAKPEFEYLKNNQWIVTEKVDGTNIRVQFDGTSVNFLGKTDRAETPSFLLEKLSELFPGDIFISNDLPRLCLYGEGYGAKIQKGGGNYIPDGCSFILFDVNVDGIWLDRDDVEDIASKLGIKAVPVIFRGSLTSAVEMVKKGFVSMLRKTPPEGVVMKPEIEMFNRRGERIVTKLKIKDFGHL
ncbi:MAG: RNA ligase family protein [Desulfamplus sp.]|nr:RNA ligase family protein [Desulfamplus sp.]